MKAARSPQHAKGHCAGTAQLRLPVDEVNRIVARLIRDRRFECPSIGIIAAGANVQRALNLPRGVVLAQEVPGSPATR